LVLRSPQLVSFVFLFLHEQDELVVLAAAKWGGVVRAMCSVQSVGRVFGVRFRQALRSRRSLACSTRSLSFSFTQLFLPSQSSNVCCCSLQNADDRVALFFAASPSHRFSKMNVVSVLGRHKVQQASRDRTF
jgi:hypothetical protein